MRVTSNSLTLFFVLTFTMTWLCWAAVLSLYGGTMAPATGATVLGTALFHLGVFAPSLVAVTLTLRSEGRAGVSRLLGQITHTPPDVRWYVFAVAFYPVIKLTAAVIVRLWTGAWPQFGDTPFYVIPFAILISTPVQAGEEVGWRGFALPRLAQTLGPALASVVVGVAWAMWHLPLFYVRGADTSGQSFTLYLIGVTALAVTMAWLYFRTQCSLLLPMLMHATVNNTSTIVSGGAPAVDNPLVLTGLPVTWATHFLLWLVAAFLLMQMRSAASRPGIGLQRPNDVPDVVHRPGQRGRSIGAGKGRPVQQQRPDP
jgi:membrane protease YdiL (CAAX protease family)